MDRKDIIRMAREAGLVRAGDNWTEPARWGVTEIERFAGLVAAAEREACAKLLDDWKKHNWTFDDCAAVIRARGAA